ncbi:MAG TPA: cupredoxin domain-containing protein [Allosphingosinicella sp.]|nr:cupredoxin domain-containing protein [Allosphingosinicella sp.]
MRPLLLLLTALCLAAPIAAPAQEPEWRQSADYDVLLEPFGIEPSQLRLEAGRPVRLRFVNSGQRSLSFSAPAFFRAARIRSGAGDDLGDGGFRLAAGERRTIVLVPAAGRYSMRSANFFHRLLGMSGRIVVE